MILIRSPSRIFMALRLFVAHLRRKLRKGLNSFPFLKFSEIYPPNTEPLYNYAPTLRIGKTPVPLSLPQREPHSQKGIYSVFSAMISLLSLELCKGLLFLNLFPTCLFHHFYILFYTE
jgi:hypothetical protein